MNLFTIDLKNQPGELAHLCQLLADHLVNIELSAFTTGDHGLVVFSASDDAAARTALSHAHLFADERPALRVGFSDRPGEGATFARKLADADINIEALLPVSICNGEVVMAVSVDKPEEARELLGDQILS